MGANLSKIGVSGLWALLFHSGLAGIFMLYYCFWTNLVSKSLIIILIAITLYIIIFS